MDISIFTQPETIITLLVLILLEIALGLDNIVFITFTCERLPNEKRSIGRHIGLIGALCMRIIFLCLANYFISLTSPFIDNVEFLTPKNCIFLIGGMYLIFNGIEELYNEFYKINKNKKSVRLINHKSKHNQIGLFQAVFTIMTMDIVFSIDSVITAVGLGNYLIVMILAMIIAVSFMFVFIDLVSNFIQKHRELKILALFFIITIGVFLILEVFKSCDESTLGFGMDFAKFVVYSVMFVSLIVVLLRIKFK